MRLCCSCKQGLAIYTTILAVPPLAALQCNSRTLQLRPAVRVGWRRRHKPTYVLPSMSVEEDEPRTPACEARRCCARAAARDRAHLEADQSPSHPSFGLLMSQEPEAPSSSKENLRAC
eukprot:6213874-Pleurochrysis_carterae.AAC.3